MSRAGLPPSFPPDTAASWQRARRYAVPRWMIERAAERRLAGDWRGACAAAGVDVAFDLAEVAAGHGRATAEALEDDLRHLAPDLLRWHLPRAEYGRTTLATHVTVILGDHRPSPAGPRDARTPVLHLRTPAMTDGPQRVTLFFGIIAGDQDSPGFWHGSEQDWTALRPLWDARRVDGLRELYAAADRVPFLRADGTPLAEEELPTEDPGSGDPVARAEWITLLHDRDEIGEALVAAGIEPNTALDDRRSGERRFVRETPLALYRLLPYLRGLVSAGIGDRFQITRGWYSSLEVKTDDDGDLVLRVAQRHDLRNVPEVPEAGWRRPPDLDLLRFGRIVPDDLHPLVRDALFPGRAPGAPAGPSEAGVLAPVRVRCRGDWHEMRMRDGELDTPHSAREQRREQALRALGGPVTGCFAVREAWTTGLGRLPRGLREQRRELFLRAQHGDVPGVLALLDAGFDPRVRDGRRRTLLHVLNLLGPEPLPRLLEAGLDLEARDHRERTPLLVAVGERGPRTLVEALLAAGARIDVVDQDGWSLLDMIEREHRADLPDLAELLERRHPDLGNGWGKEH